MCIWAAQIDGLGKCQLRLCVGSISRLVNRGMCRIKVPDLQDMPDRGDCGRDINVSHGLPVSWGASTVHKRKKTFKPLCVSFVCFLYGRTTS